MSIYDRLAKTADRLLSPSKFGKQLTITRVLNTAYNTSSGVVSKNTTTYTVNGQVFEYSDYRVAQSGGLIKNGDRRVLVSGLSCPFDPNPTTDTITLNGVPWSIVSVGKPVDEDVLLELQVRRV